MYKDWVLDNLNNWTVAYDFIHCAGAHNGRYLFVRLPSGLRACFVKEKMRFFPSQFR